MREESDLGERMTVFADSKRRLQRGVLESICGELGRPQYTTDLEFWRKRKNKGGQCWHEKGGRKKSNGIFFFLFGSFAF